MNPTGELHTVEWDSTMCVTNSAGKLSKLVLYSIINKCTLVSAQRKSNFKWSVEQ